MIEVIKMERVYTKDQVIKLVNDYECQRVMGEISTPNFEEWLNLQP
jgi:hypothetical protein